MSSVDWHLIVHIRQIKSCSVTRDLAQQGMSAYLSGCLSFYLQTRIWESKRISCKMSTANNTSCPFVLFLPYFFKSCLFSSRKLKLHYLQNAFPHFMQLTLQVFSVFKQQICSLSEYIPRKRTECICCTYVVKCKIYKSHLIDYYPMFTSTSSSGSAFTRQRR
jgi:hypothetical protein